MNNNLSTGVNKPASLTYNISNGVPVSYADKILNPGGSSKWRHQPNNVPLVNKPMFIPQGNQLPLAFESRTSLPPPDSMFYFNNNQVSLACCPSTYTTDMGCVCTTPEQRRFIGEQRGNNKNYSSYPSI